MYDEYDELNELLEEAYLEGYYDNIFLEKGEYDDSIRDKFKYKRDYHKFEWLLNKYDNMEDKNSPAGEKLSQQILKFQRYMERKYNLSKSKAFPEPNEYLNSFSDKVGAKIDSLRDVPNSTKAGVAVGTAAGVGITAAAIHSYKKKKAEEQKIIELLKNPVLRKKHPELVKRYRKQLIKAGVALESYNDELDELLEEAYLEGYYDSIDNYDDYYSEKKIDYRDPTLYNNLDKLPDSELQELRKQLMQARKRHAIRTGLNAAGAGVSSLGAFATGNMLADTIKDPDEYNDKHPHLRRAALGGATLASVSGAKAFAKDALENNYDFRYTNKQLKKVNNAIKNR